MVYPAPQEPKKRPQFPIQKLYKPAFYIGMTFFIWLAGVILSPLVIADEAIADGVWILLIAIVEISNKVRSSKKPKE